MSSRGKRSKQHSKPQDSVRQQGQRDAERVIARGMVAQSITTSYSGPLPPPAILDGYNQIVPNAAERILKLAEEQARHRMKLENHVVMSDIRRSWVGLILGFIVAMTSVIGGLWLAYLGHTKFGALLSGGTIAALVGTFVYGTRSRQKERLEKAEKVQQTR